MFFLRESCAVISHDSIDLLTSFIIICNTENNSKRHADIVRRKVLWEFSLLAKESEELKVRLFNLAESSNTRETDPDLIQLGGSFTTLKMPPKMKSLIGVVVAYVCYCNDDTSELIESTLRRYFRNDLEAPKFHRMLLSLPKYKPKLRHQ